MIRINETYTQGTSEAQTYKPNSTEQEEERSYGDIFGEIEDDVKEIGQKAVDDVTEIAQTLANEVEEYGRELAGSAEDVAQKARDLAESTTDLAKKAAPALAFVCPLFGAAVLGVNLIKKADQALKDKFGELEINPLTIGVGYGSKIDIKQLLD